MLTNDEELLVLKAKRGDEKALLVLDQWYRKKVVNVIMGRLLLPREDSEEIYHSMFTNHRIQCTNRKIVELL